jgi:hypothetical protein
MKRALTIIAFSLLCCAATPAQSSQCSIRFNVVKYDGRLLAGQLSDAQRTWWNGKGARKYKDACLDENTPEYLIVWGQEMETHQGGGFVYHPGTTSTGTFQMGNGDGGNLTTTTPGTTTALVPMIRNVSRVHVYIFAWRNEKLDGPLWIKDRIAEGWGERAWNQPHPASQQLLQDALKFLARKQ